LPELLGGVWKSSSMLCEDIFDYDVLHFLSHKLQSCPLGWALQAFFLLALLIIYLLAFVSFSNSELI
jgi:hypothetical protein